jgi:uncharacterized membrane protein YfcA
VTSGDLKLALLGTIAVFGLLFARAFVSRLRQLAGRASAAATPANWRPSIAESATGFVTTFFDALGIGNFATTTAIFRARRLVPDELIPGTLNVGHTPAAILSAFVFIQLVPVEAGTLLPMIAASGLGAWLGSGIVSRLVRHQVRLGMGAALLAAACLMLLTQLGSLPGGGDALGLHGARWVIAVAGNVVLGALMTLGIGLYAPCMIMVSLLGMNPLAAFPIMMGSCALLMSISGVRFLREDRYHPSASVGLTLGGVPALLLAAYVVKSLPVDAIRWLVITVVLYTALTLVQAGRAELRGRRPETLRTGRPSGPRTYSTSVPEA